MCAGAVGSPQLLMLSGIGPAGQLRALGIDPVADLPGVGENLQDHPVAMACYASPGPLPRSRYNHGRCTPRCAARWPARGRTCTCSRSCCPSRRPGASRPPRVMPWPPRWSPRTAGAGSGSRAADPQAAPVINPGFLRDQRDLDRLEAGLAMIRQAAASPALRPGPRGRDAPGPGVCTSAGLRDWIRGTVGSYWHPAGTCRIGPTPIRARWWTPSCGSAGSPGCGSPTPR